MCKIYLSLCEAHGMQFTCVTFVGWQDVLRKLASKGHLVDIDMSQLNVIFMNFNIWHIVFIKF